MGKIWILLLASLFVASPVFCATYHVDVQTGDDSRGGTSPALSWQTIGKCAQEMVAGDTCLVASGIYEESVRPRNSGSENSPITYAAQGGATPIVRNFTLNGDDYIRIIGFTITHNSLAYIDAIGLYDSNYCQILNNSIHHVRRQGIRNNTYYRNSNHNVIRGNRFDYIGCPDTGSMDDCKGGNGIALNGSFNLIEYNDASHTLDFFDLNGQYNVIRNNYAHDFKNSDFPGGSGDAVHVDFWQPFSITDNLTNNCLVENNFAVDIWEVNSHFFQVRNGGLLGIYELIIRGNVGARFGSYVAQFGGVERSRLYNNTFCDFDYNQEKGWTTVGYSSEPRGGLGATNNFNFNNVYYRTCRTNGYIISVSPESSLTAENNGCIDSGTHASCQVSSGITFVDIGSDDFHPHSSSTARTNGRPITTITSPDGSGTTFQVEDAGFFVGGWDVRDLTGERLSDRIKIGNGAPVLITSINYDTNMVTVEPSISWLTGDPVVLAHQDGQPTLGAYEYQASNVFDITMVEPVPQSQNVVLLSATSTNPSTIRYVEFYADGLPVGGTRIYPYSVDWTAGANPRTVNVEAKAYSLFATKTPVKSDSVTYVHNGSETVPVPPASLKMRP